jgi:hypothetical protein
MVPGVVLLLVFFVLIGSPVSSARNIYGVGTRVELGDRVTLLAAAVMRSGEAPAARENTAWARFCYLAPQAAALNFYDQGTPSGTFGLIGWSLLPRVLFPSKPVITAGAADFHYQITGQAGSAAGTGVFVDGYYNLGWWGVIFVGIAVGLILGLTSAFAAQVYEARATMWMPLALLGSFMGFRIDGAFVADYWGPFVLFGYALLAGAALMESSRMSGYSNGYA